MPRLGSFFWQSVMRVSQALHEKTSHRPKLLCHGQWSDRKCSSWDHVHHQWSPFKYHPSASPVACEIRIFGLGTSSPKHCPKWLPEFSTLALFNTKTSCMGPNAGSIVPINHWTELNTTRMLHSPRVVRMVPFKHIIDKKSVTCRMKNWSYF